MKPGDVVQSEYPDFTGPAVVLATSMHKATVSEADALALLDNECWEEQPVTAAITEQVTWRSVLASQQEDLDGDWHDHGEGRRWVIALRLTIYPKDSLS